MNEQYAIPTGKRLALAKQLYDTLTDWEALVRPEESESRFRNITFRRLYAYASDTANDTDGELRKTLARNSRIAADFRSILEKTADISLPEAAAAAGNGAITGRDGPGCRIRFAQSEAEPSQTYILIEMEDKEAAPKMLFVVYADETIRSWPLPQARRGVIQLLEERESALLKALLDPKTGIFLS